MFMWRNFSAQQTLAATTITAATHVLARRPASSSTSTNKPSLPFDAELLGVLSASLPKFQQQRQGQSHDDRRMDFSKRKQQQGTKRGRKSRSAAGQQQKRPRVNAPLPEEVVRFLQCNNITDHPPVPPPALPYLVPNKWVECVKATLKSHFGVILQQQHSGGEDSSSSSSSTSPHRHNALSGVDGTTTTVVAKRPALFLQCFVHPSFLRRSAELMTTSDNNGEQNNNNNSNNNTSRGGENDDEDDPSLMSMSTLADVGSAVLSNVIHAMAPLLAQQDIVLRRKKSAGGGLFPSPPQEQRQRSSLQTTSTKTILVPTTLGTSPFPSSSSSSSSVDAAGEYFSATTKCRSFLNSAIADHPLSLVCFNVWKCSDLVLTDAGIYGLRDALRSSAKAASGGGLHQQHQQQQQLAPALPMPAAAMCVRAVVGAVYLNYGMDAAVEFCQRHVVAHAVDMVDRRE